MNPDEIRVIETDKIMELSNEDHIKLWNLLEPKDKYKDAIVLREKYPAPYGMTNGRSGIVGKFGETEVIFVVEHDQETKDWIQEKNQL